MVYPEILDSILVLLLAQLLNKQRLPKTLETAATESDTQVNPTNAAEFFIFNSVSFVLLKVFEELSHAELFNSVNIDKSRQETEIFNYFAKKMSE